MNLKVAIRNEVDADASAISEVTVAAFKTLEVSHHTEQFIVAALRAANALAVSLVAEADGRVIGHIAFSPLAISDGTRNWYGLGPVSVLPQYQRQGIGKTLVREGLSRLKDMNAQGCCLVGHPDYYRKFGFRKMPGLVLEGVPQEVFFALSFAGQTPQGSVTFHDAFEPLHVAVESGAITPRPAYRIGRLTAADAEAFSLLRREVTADNPVAMGITYEEELTRPLQGFRDQLSFAEPNAAFGAFVDAELVGTAAVAWPSRRPSSVHKVNLWAVFVSPRYRRLGIGRALVETAVAHARANGVRRVNLTVFLPNEAAVQLYESLGFRHCGMEPEAIRIGGSYHDGCLMSWRQHGP